jgi:hypothetical protein
MNFGIAIPEKYSAVEVYPLEVNPGMPTQCVNLPLHGRPTSIYIYRLSPNTTPKLDHEPQDLSKIEPHQFLAEDRLGNDTVLADFLVFIRSWFPFDEKL